MFTGMTALVTGGGRGIGASVCRELAGKGAFVFINCNRSEKKASEVLEEIRSAGGDGLVVTASVHDPDSVDKMFRIIRKSRRKLDILVNNAGIMQDSFLGSMSLKTWHRVLETNLTGLFLCSRAAVKMMIAKRTGHIVNISSISALSGNMGQCNYAATKGGIISFTRSLALEVSPYNIHVNCVVAGSVERAMFLKVPMGHRNKIIQSVPLKRMGKPEEIATVVRFLVSEDASYIQGQSIIVDGGLIHP